MIALGAGDGYLEVRLVQNLLSRCKNPDIELLLFDISQPLLTTAYQHAIDTFGEQSAVHTLLVTGLPSSQRAAGFRVKVNWRWSSLQVQAVARPGVKVRPSGPAWRRARGSWV